MIDQFHRYRRRHVAGEIWAAFSSRILRPKRPGRASGLLIVRRIVREHGGELAIESSEGKGLTLSLRLPYIDKRVRMLEAGKSQGEK